MAKVRKAYLVYQDGIANVFAVKVLALVPGARGAKRLYQGTFVGARHFALGLAAAGVKVRTAGCNRAGDVRTAEWTADLESLPFADQCFAVEDN